MVFSIAPFDPRDLPEHEQHHSDIDVYRARVASCLLHSKWWSYLINDMPKEWADKFVREAHEDKVYAAGTAYLMAQIHGRGLKGLPYTDFIRDDGQINSL